MTPRNHYPVLRTALIPIVGCLLIAAGCTESSSSGSSSSDSSAAGDQETPPKSASESDGTGGGAVETDRSKNVRKDLFGTASIKGLVRFDGKRPPARPLRMQGDGFCSAHGGTTRSPRTVISQSGGVPHVFAYVRKGIDGRYSVPGQAVTLDQKGCMFAPHVFGLQVGQPLRIINSDDTCHNVHGLTKRNTEFNVSQPAKDMETIKSFGRPEVMVKFKCDVHGWMDAYCGVLPHPFFNVTDGEGRFEISRLPAGDYVIEAWHELWGSLRVDVTLEAGDTRDVTLTYARSRKVATD